MNRLSYSTLKGGMFPGGISKYAVIAVYCPNGQNLAMEHLVIYGIRHFRSILYPALALKDILQSIFHKLPIGAGEERRPVVKWERVHSVQLAANRVQCPTLMISYRMGIREGIVHLLVRCTDVIGTVASPG